MFLEESKRIREILALLKLRKGQTVLDIGSSSEKYRCLDQPYIDYYVFCPLRKSGIKVIHIDMKQEDGVDIVCDLATTEINELIKKIKLADVILCTSLLEHLSDRELILNRIKSLTKPHGVIILTVPYLFEYHPDPIDTGFRPSNLELERLFPKEQYSIITSEILEIYSLPAYIKNRLSVRVLNRIMQRFHSACIDKEPKIIPSKMSLVAVRKTK